MQEMTMNEVCEVSGADLTDIYNGIILAGGAILVVAALPEAVAIASVVGVAALAVEGAGIALALVGVIH